MAQTRLLFDDDLVVRGGTKRSVASIEPVLVEAIDMGYGAVLSVFIDSPGTDGREAALYRICDDADVPHGQIQVTTVGQLRTAGFDILPHVEGDWPENHCHVIFDEPLSNSQIEAFISVFGEPEKNPTGGRKARS